jgi:hypothetical protein
MIEGKIITLDEFDQLTNLIIMKINNDWKQAESEAFPEKDFLLSTVFAKEL